MRRSRNLLGHPELSVMLFSLGFVLLNWPFLGIFRPQHSGGLFVYLFLVWILAVFFLFLISRSCNDLSSEKEVKEEGKDDV